MRWGENETYQFVKIYLSHEYLWNTDHVNYKLKDKRQKAYQAIIDEFRTCSGIRLNENEVRIKVKNLRSTYTQEIAKIRTRSSPNSPYIPTIKWFADWHGCFKHKSRKPIMNLVYDEPINTDELNNKTWLAETIEPVTNEKNIDLFASQTEDYGLTVKCEPNIMQSDKTSHSSYKLKRKKLKMRSPSTDQCNRMFRSSHSSFDSISKEDEFDIYGRYIASQLRNLNLQKALRLQLEIQSLGIHGSAVSCSSLLTLSNFQLDQRRNTLERNRCISSTLQYSRVGSW